MIEVLRYLEIPFVEHGRDERGVDCWGLVRLIYRDAYGIDLPDYTDVYETTGDHTAIARQINDARADWTRLSGPRAGAVVEIAIAGHPWHVGVMLNEAQFIHALRGVGVSVERVTDRIWARRVQGYFVP